MVNSLVIYSLYQNIKSCISINGSNSAFFESFIGLRQGESILFFIFLNDLEDFLTDFDNQGIDFEHRDDEVFYSIKLLVLLYADDTVIMADSPETFKNVWMILWYIAKKWRLNINFDKMKVLIFGARKIPVKKFYSGWP